MYRTHLFGSPSIIACFPMANKFVLQSSDLILHWPSADLVGPTSLVMVHGKAHYRIRSFVMNAINHPDALRRITLMVQPRMVDALQSWAKRGRVKAYDETKRVAFSKLCVVIN